RLLEVLEARDESELERFVLDQPVFQNITYPLALSPLVVGAAELAEHRATVEAYVALLEKLVALYRADQEVRGRFSLAPFEEELVAAEGDLPRAVRVCRLDGYLDREGGAFQILENNADCPAGTLFTPRLQRMFRTLLGDAAPRRMLAMDERD